MVYAWRIIHTMYVVWDFGEALLPCADRRMKMVFDLLCIFFARPGKKDTQRKIKYHAAAG